MPEVYRNWTQETRCDGQAPYEVMLDADNRNKVVFDTANSDVAYITDHWGGERGFDKTGREDFALIRRAIQNHDALLAACKRAIEDRQCAQFCDGPHDNCPCFYCSTCAVIRKAEAALL